MPVGPRGILFSEARPCIAEGLCPVVSGKYTPGLCVRSVEAGVVERMAEDSEAKNVLVVDDDSDFVKILEMYLKLSGLDVTCAFCGMGALEELKVSSPSAVILDLVMPDIDGLGICRFIREKLGDKDTPVIVLTALSDSKSRTEILEAGANEFLTKPCDFELIFKTVQEYTS